MRWLVQICTRLMVLFTALGMAAPASAQSNGEARSIAEPNTVTVTPFLTGTFGTSDDLGGSIGLGVGVGYDFTRNLGVEGEIGHAFDVLGNAHGRYNALVRRLVSFERALACGR
jgi:hypothetical protein